MTRFARIHRKKSANIKAAPEEATSWAEFKAQMKNKKDTSQVEQQVLSVFPENDNYYSKNTYKSSWCDFEPEESTSSKTNSTRIEDNEMLDDKAEGPPRKSKKRKLQKRNNFSKDVNVEFKEEHFWAGNDSEVNPKSKSKKRIFLSESEENSAVICDDKEQLCLGTENSLIKNKKRRYQESFTTESSNCSNKRKYKISDDKKEKVKVVDSVDRVPARKKNRYGSEHNQGENSKKNKIGLGNEMSLQVDGRKVKMTKFDGFYILETDAERIRTLKQKMVDEGRSREEIEGIVRRHRRNAEKFVSRKKKKICFHCREGEHNLSQCPKLDGQNGPVGSSVCYKCGSTEHLLHQCKIPGNDLKFAKCFICNEVGHLSKQCPDNPRGLYPNGGGCRVCGDVTHLKRDCPELIKKKKYNTITLGTIGDSIESLEEDRKLRSNQSSVPTKRVNKIIKFE
ncbi:uncharacterized protein [Rhodnius prolixus]|uniref:Putative zinc finger protein n=1 Tax=Rhodnius prolixus TaxID=13249 RepID=R4G475_RHOPR